jgi:D-inositol-3-phosphate glycosyltransferase
MRERVLASGIADPEDVALVPNVVDTSLFAPGDRAAARSALGLARGALVVSFIGKPDDATAYRGRHPVMIEALMALQSGLPHELAARLVVLIVGAGGQSVAVGLGGVRCVCVGRVESEVGMARCFAASDVYLSTSQYDNLPAVVQESLACGVPVVASAVGGIPEMVIDGATGRLAAPQDPAGFARQLIGLLTDEGLRAKLAGSARALAEQRFSPSAVMPAMLSVYRSAGAVFAGQSRGGIR